MLHWNQSLWLPFLKKTENEKLNDLFFLFCWIVFRLCTENVKRNVPPKPSKRKQNENMIIKISINIRNYLSLEKDRMSFIFDILESLLTWACSGISRDPQTVVQEESVQPQLPSRLLEGKWQGRDSVQFTPDIIIIIMIIITYFRWGFSHGAWGLISIFVLSTKRPMASETYLFNDNWMRAVR